MIEVTVKSKITGEVKTGSYTARELFDTYEEELGDKTNTLRLSASRRSVWCRMQLMTIGQNMRFISVMKKRRNVMRKATDKQLQLIARMESLINKKFTGSTIKEASEFISKHMDEYHEQKELVAESDILYNDIYYYEHF